MKIAIDSAITSSMSHAAIEDRAVIVSPKQKPEAVTFRWDPALLDEVRGIAKRTGRSINETGEMLMTWAVEASKRELAARGVPEASTPDTE